MKTFFEKFLNKKKDLKIYRQEALLIDFAEMIYEIMEKRGLTEKDLAKEIGVSTRQIKKWLSGKDDLTLRTISEMLFVLYAKLKIVQR